MAVTTDGVGNYFSGNEAIAVNHTQLINDITSAFGTLNCSFDFSSDYNLAWRAAPADELLNQAISNSVVNLNTGGALTTGARWHTQIAFGIGSVSNCVLYFMNGSAGMTGVITLEHNNVSGLSNNTIRTNLSGAKCWAVMTSRSFAMFQYKDASNYFFVSQGDPNLDNPTVTFPDNKFGIHILETGGIVSVGSFTVANFVSPALELYTESLCNYVTTPTSGSAGQSWEFIGRNRNPGFGNDGYGHGKMLNVVQMDTSALTGINIGDVVELNNITDSNLIIDGSAENRYIMVGRLGNVASNDKGGDGLFMRIKKA